MIKVTLTVDNKIVKGIPQTISKDLARTDAEKQIKAVISAINALDFWEVLKITIEFKGNAVI